MSNRFEIAQKFAKTIKCADIDKIILFGSVARGEDTDNSDIDILIISPDTKKIEHDVDEEVVNVILETEELISAHLMSVDRFNKTKNNPFLRNVIKEGILLG